jgi:hypothetical protein
MALSSDTVLASAPMLYESACEHFGDWITALRYAGISRRRAYLEVFYTQERVIHGLRKLCIGSYNLTSGRCIRRNRTLYWAARRHFGTWRSALQASGINTGNIHLPRGASHFTQSKVIEALRQRKFEGRSLRWKDICLENRYLAGRIKAKFGSLTHALQRAGISPSEDRSKRKTD